MNKTFAYALGVVVLVAGLAGILYLAIERPDASATFTSTFVLLFGLLASYFAQVNGNAKITDRLQEVEKNTNGRLGAKDAELERKDRLLLDAGLDPQTGEPVTGSTPTQGPPLID